MSSIMNFESAVYVNEQLNRLMVNAAQDLAQRSIKACAEHYNFDAEEAQRLLGLMNVKLSRARPVEEKPKKVKVIVAKAAFPMPYNGEFNDACCFALRQNSGLYTQCQAVRKSKTTDGKNGDFCKQCQVLADKTEGVPEYGTIQMRQAVGIFEYTDPKGRKPVAYTKVMKKYKIDQEKVLEEAGKFNVQINAEHFVVAEVDSKRGRPSSQKEKAPKEAKGSKGRPKKAKKVLQIEGDDDDLFASLVADANNNSGDEAVIAPKTKSTEAKSEPKKRGKSDEEKEAERLAKEVEKQQKEAIRLQEKADKDFKLALEKLEKEQKKQLEDEARAAKKETERLEREAKKIALELAKKEKEEKLAAEKLAKETKTKKPAAAPKAAKEPEVEEEPDVVKKIEFEGKKYLKSKKSGIIYDYQEYVKNGEQVMVGKWNESKNKIDFNKAADEESEEEYDM
jgi:hypothetical protein